MAWILFTPSDDIRVEHAAIHAIPDNDIHGHRIDEDGTCGCNPWLDEEADGLLYVHRAFDGREAIIHRTRKPS